MTFTFTIPEGAPCTIYQLGDLVLDQVTADPDGVYWGVESIEGWWDSPDVRVGLIPQVVGARIHGVRRQHRSIVLNPFAFLRSGAIGSLAFDAMKRLTATVEESYNGSIELTSIDPGGGYQANVRLAGDVQSRIIGELLLVQFQVPLTAANPNLTEL